MKLWANLSLKKRMTFLTLLGLMLGSGVYSLLGIHAVNQATEVMLQDRMTTASLVAGYVDEALTRALDELGSMAVAVADLKDGGDIEREINELDRMYERLSLRVNSIYLVDTRGRVTWSHPLQAQSMTLNVADYPDVAGILGGSGAGASVSGLVVGPDNRTPVVLLACPTSGDSGCAVVVVAVDIARSSIGGFVHPIRLGQTGYVEIVDANGVVVARTEPGPKLAPFEKSDHSGRFAALINDGKPTRGLCHTCHEPVNRVEREDVLAFVPLNAARWGVILRQSQAEALAPTRELRRNVLLFGAGFALVTLLTVVLTTRDVVSRVRMLTSASRRITGGDLLSPVPLAGSDEIGMLARTFENMRSRLNSSYSELAQRTQELASLLAVAEHLTSLNDLSDLDGALTAALEKTVQILQVDYGYLLADEDGGQMSCQAQWPPQPRISGLMSELGGRIAGTVTGSGKAFIVENCADAGSHADDMSRLGLGAFACLALKAKEKVLGVLLITSKAARPFRSGDVRLLEGIAGQIATAMENARLHRELQKRDNIRRELLQEILKIQEDERRRIARELHDETSQVVASLNANLEAAAGTLPISLDQTEAILRKTQALSINLLDGIHKLIYELRPSLLDDLGLIAAAEWLADNNLRLAGVKVIFKTVGRSRRLPQKVETTLFRIIQEAISNIARHANAHNASVTLSFRKGLARVEVRDDGEGFDVNEALGSKQRPRGLGLLGMKERAALVNGVCNIRSTPGLGTEIEVEIPLG